eukprot:scaffold847_cov72-Skeletonema_dohrnii-CCMP3373.AAC.1
MDPSDVNLLALTTATPKAIKTVQRMIGDDWACPDTLMTKNRRRPNQAETALSLPCQPIIYLCGWYASAYFRTHSLVVSPVAIESHSLVGLFGLQYLRCGGNQASHLLLSLGEACVMNYAFTIRVHNIEDELKNWANLA